MSRPRNLDILVVGMDKVTDKSCYLYDALAKEGVQSLLYTRDKTGFAQEVKGRLRTPIKLVPSSLLGEFVNYLSLLIRERPGHVELYHTYLTAQLLYTLAARALRVPLSVVSIGSLYHWSSACRLRKWADKLMYRNADMVVLTERYMADTLTSYGITELNKTIFVHNRVPVRNQARVEREGKNVLFLNSFKPWRRVELLLDAIPFVLARVPDARFQLVGSTLGIEGYLDNTNEYERMLRERLGRLRIDYAVELLPFTPEPHSYYEQASVFVLPADLVYCNFSLLEAMERAIPAVVADVDGADLIVEDGVSGFVCEQDPEVFAKRIVMLLSDKRLRQRLGRGAREKVQREYEISQAGELLLKGYRDRLNRDYYSRRHSVGAENTDQAR